MTRSRDLRLNFYAHIAARIRERRIEVGMPQKELAEILGMTQQAMSKLEAGKTTIAVDTLWWIARSLDTTVSFYFEGLPSFDSNGVAASGAELRGS